MTIKTVDDLIKDELEAIEGYDKIIKKIVEDSENCGDEVLNCLNNIRSDEIRHIEMLNFLKKDFKDNENKETLNSLFGVNIIE